VFDLGPRYSQETDAFLAQKVKKAKGSSSSSSGGSSNLSKRIADIRARIDDVFGHNRDRYKLILSEDALRDYINSVVSIGEVALDTETSGLDEISDVIAGFSMYVDGLDPIYCPINHLSFITGEKVEGQQSPEFIKQQFQRLNECGTKIIFHNAKFDIRVIKNQIGITLKPYWDTMVAAACLNENEPKGLKPLWDKYCSESTGAYKRVDYSALFQGMSFTLVPIDVGCPYAAADTVKTYELYKFQDRFLNNRFLTEQSSYSGITNNYRNVEIPLISVLSDIEDTGVIIDRKYAQVLGKEYEQKLIKAETEFHNFCLGIKNEIDSYRFLNPKCKLGNPINVGSPDQVACLLYDVMKLPSVDKNSPRGTGEEILLKIGAPICSLILEYRGIAKLLSTYINKLPRVVNNKTGRLHGRFSQTTAVTGRLASSDPNLQNIPAGKETKKVRKLFSPSQGFVIVSGDYSQQEPRILAYVSQDANLIQAYKDNKDIYAFIASVANKVPYEECLEFRPDGTTNPAGKQRRNHIKAIVLGIIYSKGVKSIAEDLRISDKAAQEIMDTFFTAFPKVGKFIKQTQDFARQHGYVETLGGRKRRLPEMQYPKYTFELVDGKPRNFDPLFDDDDEDISFEIAPETIQSYTDRLNKCWGFKQKRAVLDEALSEGIKIKDNSYIIAEAERQCVNSVIQGSAAVMTKIALIHIHNNPRLKELGFRILLTVHDEINGECPYEHREECKKLLCDLMVSAAAGLCPVPMKVDPCIEVKWTQGLDDDLIQRLKDKYNSGMLIEEIAGEEFIDPLLAEKIIKETN
jgi:DNA polymerase I-like protein with 3'-5' exonuclease and polymerase domains